MRNVTIYTTSTCPYCIAAKALLRKKGAAFEEINVEGNPQLREVMRRRANGGSTVPQIFIGDTHVGGCDDLHDLEHSGGLDPLLKSA